MAAEVGKVYVSVMPSARGFSKALTSDASSAGTSAGRGFSASFGKIVAGSAVGNIISSAVSKVSGAIAGSLGAAISRVDTLNNFPKVMQNLGYGAQEAEVAINTLSAGIDGMPTSLDGIVSMTQQLAPLCGGLDEATTLSLAMNNMFLASRASTADQTRAMQQYTQMLARGKVELNDWRTLQEVMPGQLNQVAQAMLGAGKNSTDLYEALKNGEVTMADFNAAVVKLNSEGMNGFASFEEQARSSTEGIGTAMENTQNRVAKAVGSILDHIGQGNISGAINGFSSQFGAMAAVVCEVWDGIVSTIDVTGFAAAWDNLTSSLAGVFAQGGTALSFGETVGGMINGLIPIIQTLTPILTAIASALKFCLDNASWLAPVIVVLVIAFQTMSVVQSVSSFLSGFGNAAAAVSPKATGCATSLLQAGAAALMIAGAVALAAAGVWIMVQAATQLSEGGLGAALALGGLVAVIGILAGLFALLGPALDVAAVGMLAFGAAVLMCGAGLALAGVGAELVANALPSIADNGAMAAVGLITLNTALLLATPGLILFEANAAIAILTVGGLALAMWGLAEPAKTVGTGLKDAGNGMMLVSVYGPMALISFQMLERILPNVVDSAKNASPAFTTLSEATTVLSQAASITANAFMMVANGLMMSFSYAKGLAQAFVVLAGNGGLVAQGLNEVTNALPAFANAASGTVQPMTSIGQASVQTAYSVMQLVPAYGNMIAANTACISALGLIMATLMKLQAMLASTMNVFRDAMNTENQHCAALRQMDQAANSSSQVFAASTASMASSVQLLRNNALSAVNAITSAFASMRLHIPSPTLGKMPHFYMTGKFDTQTGSVPRIGVNWYAKGGVFERPSIIGVGEAGREVVAPENMLKKYLDEAVKRSSDPGVSIHDCTFVIRKESDINSVAEELSKRVRREVRASL